MKAENIISLCCNSGIFHCLILTVKHQQPSFETSRSPTHCNSTIFKHTVSIRISLTISRQYLPSFKNVLFIVLNQPNLVVGYELFLTNDIKSVKRQSVS